MKRTNREIGNIGEDHASAYLIKSGYEILERNWRYSRAEIDIIAKKEGILVFIEVKTRSYTYFGEPSEAVGVKKEALLMDAGQRYMEKIDHEWEIRFDIISVIISKSGGCLNLEHFEDVFFA